MVLGRRSSSHHRFLSPEPGEHALDAKASAEEEGREGVFVRLDSLPRGSPLLKEGKAPLPRDSPFPLWPTLSFRLCHQGDLGMSSSSTSGHLKLGGQRSQGGQCLRLCRGRGRHCVWGTQYLWMSYSLPAAPRALPASSGPDVSSWRVEGSVCVGVFS